MISEVFLGNFQGFGEGARAPLAPLTLIFGPNASGKSSVSRAIRVMKQSTGVGGFQVGHSWMGEEVNLGSASGAIRGQLLTRDSPSRVCLGLGWTKSNGKSFHYLVEENLRDFGLRFQVSATAGPDQIIHMSLDKIKKGWASGQAFTLGHEGLTDLTNAFEELFDELPDDSLSLFGNRISLSTPDDYSDYWEDFGAATGHQFDRFLEGLFEASSGFSNELYSTSFIEPLRPVPPKFELVSGLHDQELDSLSDSEEEHMMQNKLMEQLTGGRYGLQTSLRKVQDLDVSVKSQVVIDQHTGVELGFDQVGMGLSQVLPIVQDLCSGSGLTFVEQPELHLHPKMQSALMDGFIDAVLADDSRQFVLETHSESMLLRTQKRIREGKISADKVAILFVDSGELDDGTKFNSIEKLALDHVGDFIDPLPISFMDLRMQDLL